MLPFFGKMLSAVVSLAKAEISTMVGISNLFFAILLGVMTIFVANKIFAQSTLDWAAITGVDEGIFLPLMVCFGLVVLMLMASLFIIYKDDARR